MATQDSNKPPILTLPPYPELIFSAIEAVDDKNGASKSAIKKHIEATYGPLPAAHSTLLSHHLNRMKKIGQLIIVKNNYVKPDPNAPPRRGRGRPPKPKASPPPGAVVSPPRPRGRPPRSSSDALAPRSTPKKATPSPSGRKRGRPPTKGKTAAEAPPPPTPSGGTVRGRGRPPKVKPEEA